jgi:protein phosphatase
VSRATPAARREHVHLAVAPHIYGLTDIGLVRERNEDDFYADPAESVLVVADGLGGLPGGDVASRVAVEAVAEVLGSAASGVRDAETARARLAAAFDAAQGRVVEAGAMRRPPAEIATALVIGCIRADTFYVGHVGDVRAYRLTRGRLTRLTDDHTKPGELLALGMIDEEGARRHPERNILHQCLGAGAGIVPSFRAEPLAAGDRLLLCSDGLWESMPAQTLEAVVRGSHGELAALAQALLKAALDAGGRDNITVLLYEHTPQRSRS